MGARSCFRASCLVEGDCGVSGSNWRGVGLTSDDGGEIDETEVTDEAGEVAGGGGSGELETEWVREGLLRRFGGTSALHETQTVPMLSQSND